MHTIRARNVNHALSIGVNMFRHAAIEVFRTAPRGHPTLEWWMPVTTVYDRPTERVLFSPLRDANPFFHLFESLWILAGRSDVAFLAHFLPRMRDYSDDGKTFHAPYGARLLNYAGMGGLPGINQLQEVANMLKADPETRRAVCSIWDVELDLGINSKDIPCNDLLAFRVRSGKLDLTVYNRSNDMIWGAYGANAVQFSFILEYVAGLADLPVGRYFQVSNSFHVYINEQWDRLKDMGMMVDDPYALSEEKPSDLPPIAPMSIFTGASVEDFDRDLGVFFKMWDTNARLGTTEFTTPYFRDVVKPMYAAYNTYTLYRADRDRDLIKELPEVVAESVAAKDWALAAGMWLNRRVNREAK